MARRVAIIVTARDRASRVFDRISRRSTIAAGRMGRDTRAMSTQAERLNRNMRALGRQDATLNVRTRGIDRAERRINRLQEELRRAGRTEASVGVSSGQVRRAQRQVERLARRLERLNRRGARLNVNTRDVVRAERRVDRLRRRINRIDSVLRIDTSRARRQGLAFERVTARGVHRMLRDFSGSIGRLLQKLARVPGVFSVVMVGILAIVVRTAAAMGSLLGGGLIVGLGAGLAALPIIFAAKNEVVKKVWKGTVSRMGKELTRLSKPFRPVLINIARMMESTFNAISPTLGRSFKLLAPVIERFAENLAMGLRALEPAIMPISRAFKAILDELGPRLPRIFSRIADSLIRLANSIAARPDIFVDLVEGLLNLIPLGINFLNTLFRMEVRIRAVVGAMDRFANRLDIFGNIARGGRSAIRGLVGAFNQFRGSRFFGSMVAGFTRAREAMMRHSRAVGRWSSRVGRTLTRTFSGVVAPMRRSLGAAMETLRGWGRTVAGWARSVGRTFRSLWRGITSTFGRGGQSGIIRGFRNLRTRMAGIARTIGRGFLRVWNGIFGAAARSPLRMSNATTRILRGLGGRIGSWLRNTGATLRRRWGGAWTAMMGGLRRARNVTVGILRGLGGRIGSWVRNTGSTLRRRWSGAWTAMMGGLRRARGITVGILRGLGGRIGSWVRNTGATLRRRWSGAWTAMMSGLRRARGITVGILRNLGGRIGSWVRNTGATLRRRWSGAWSAMMAGLRRARGITVSVLRNLGSRIGSWVRNTGATLRRRWSAAWSAMMAGLRRARGITVSILRNLGARIGGWVRNTGATLRRRWSAAWSAMMAGLRRARSITVSVLRNLGARIGGWIRNTGATLRRHWSTAWSRMISGLRRARGIIIANLRTLFRRIQHWASGAVRWLPGAGRMMIVGFSRGIRNAMRNIRGWLRRHVWNPIVRGVKELFGISSPSKVFVGFGKAMIGGLMKGLISRSPKKFVSKIFGGLNKTSAKALSFLVDKGKVSINALMKLKGKAGRLVGNMFGGMRGGGPGFFPGGRIAGGLAGWVRAAMRATRTPGSWFRPLVGLAMHESGGNPRAINLWDCLPLRTNILTRRGWLSHDEVRVGDETLGFNPETGRSEWTLITRVVHYDDAPIVRVGNKRWSVECTPNHRWWTERKTSRTPQPETCLWCDWPQGVRRRGRTTQGGVRVHMAKAHGVRGLPLERAYNGQFVETQDLGGNDRVRLSAPADTGIGLPISLNEAALLGWIAGDGHVERNRRGPSISVSQTKRERFPAIEAALTDIPHARYEYPRTKCVTWRVTPEYNRDLQHRVGHPKEDAPSIVLAMSAEQRAAWLDAMVKAEGSAALAGEPRVYQCDGPVAEALELAIYLSGYRPSKSKLSGKDEWAACYSYGMCRPHVTAGPGWSAQGGDTQAVWCVTTDLGTWTAEQNGQIFLTGNSNARAGMASRGLFQTIPSTFASFSRGGSIWNPVANAIAAIRYIKARYGSIFRIPSYRGGGRFVGGYEKGAWRVPQSGFTHTGEMVVPEPWAGLVRGLASGNGSDSGGRTMRVVGGKLAIERGKNGGLEAWVRDLVLQEISDEAAFQRR